MDKEKRTRRRRTWRKRKKRREGRRRKTLGNWAEQYMIVSEYLGSQ